MTRRGFRFPFRSRADIRRELETEFAFHLQSRIEDLERTGLDAGAARAQAEREFGDRDRGLARCASEDERRERERLMRRMLDDLLRDLRHSVRTLRRSPASSAVIVLTLAVAIAANTSVFTLVNALLLKTPLLVQPDRLVRVRMGESRMSWPNFEDVRRERPGFEDVVAQEAVVVAFRSGPAPVRATGARISGSYFTLLGTPAALGRTLLPADTRTDLVVLSDRFWRTQLAGDADVVGRRVRIGDDSVEIIGVMPAAFIGLAPPGLGRDLWLPFDARSLAARADRATPSVEVFARLAPGVSRPAAQAALAVTAERLSREHPSLGAEIRVARVSGITGFDAFQGIGSAALPLFAFVAMLSVFAALVLLVACANIAGLLIGRSAARRREIAVRLALGAGRSRLVRQLLVESLLLASMGAAGGILLSVWLTRGIRGTTSRLPFPVDVDLALDWHVLLYAGLVSCLAALLFGLAPARRAARTELVPALKDDSPAGHQRFRRLLVTGQVFACTVLLLWSALFARSLLNVAQAETGFRTDSIFVIDLDSQDRNRAPEAEHDRYQRLYDRAAQLPGVEAVGLAWAVPLAFESREEHGVLLLDDGAATERRVMANTISPGYLNTVGIRLRAGRDLAWSDRATTAPVTLVNETAARLFWSGEAIGRRVRVTDRAGTVDLEVVGVVADSKYWTLGEDPTPTIYRPMLQRSMGMHLFVRTADPGITLPVLRDELERSSAGMPVEVERFSDATAASMLPARVASLATAALGAVALLLAVLGIYGLVGFSVAQRTRELAIRRAIGATSGHLLRSVLTGSLAGVALGVAPGLVLGALGGLALSGFLVGVSPFDPLTALAVTGVMLVTAGAASLPPAIRATRVDPLHALRDQ